MLLGGVVDQNVEPAEFAHGVGDQRLAKALVLQVAGERDRPAACGADELDALEGVRLFNRQIVDGDVRPLAGVGDRRRPMPESPPVMSARRPKSPPVPS